MQNKRAGADNQFLPASELIRKRYFRNDDQTNNKSLHALVQPLMVPVDFRVGMITG